MAEALRRGDLIAIVTSHAERATLDRVQAVMAVIEGHAEHVMDAVAPDLLPNLPKLRAAIDRRRRSQSGLSRLLAKLLGMDMKLRQYEQGKIFCDAVVRERGRRRAAPRLLRPRGAAEPGGDPRPAGVAGAHGADELPRASGDM